MHLFDIDIPGKITFKESESLSAGNSFSSFHIEGTEWKVGLGICYDLRFPEFSSILVNQFGCNLLIYPSAFNTTTGPLHWHILQRGRAVDTQSYIISASPARKMDAGYEAYGHSMIVEPTGQIAAEAGEGEEIVYAEIDNSVVNEVRRNIPSLIQKRADVYHIPRCK